MPEDTWYRKGPAFDQLPLGNEPKTGRPIGIPESEALGIYINDEAADFISKYIMADNQRAMGGILVGYVAMAQRPFILISGAIEAKDAEIVNGCVAFTDHSWDYMHEVRDREYPNTIVVGWFSSHPGYGTAVTGYERFTHHRAFNRPWQLIFVVDPVANTSVFYRWNEDRLTTVANFTVWNARKEPPASLLPINAVAYKALEKSAAKEPRDLERHARVEAAASVEDAAPNRLSALWPWLVFALLILLFFWPAMPWSVTRLWSTANERQGELQQLRQQLEGVADQNQSQNQIDAPASTPMSPDLPAQPQSSAIDAEANVEPNASATGSGSRASPQPAVAADTDTYEVRRGDTLWGISEKTTGDPLKYQRLAEANGIANPSLIHPGTKLQLDIRD